MDTLKALLDITDDTQDTLLQIYLDLATDAIKNYLCRDIAEEGLEKQISYLAQYFYINKDNAGNGIQSQTQGARSITYNISKNTAIPEQIKSMLPLPSVRAVI